MCHGVPVGVKATAATAIAMRGRRTIEILGSGSIPRELFVLGGRPLWV